MENPEFASSDRRDTVEVPRIFVIQETSYQLEGETRGGLYSAITNRGKNPYKENEDAFLIIPEKGFYFVADGLGGTVGGEVASLEAVLAIADLVNKNEISFSDTENILSSVLDRYDQAFQKDYTLDKMGTTLAGFSIVGNELRAMHIGDSRIYVFGGDGKIKYISKDNSIIQLKIDKMIFLEEANEFESDYLEKNLISECIREGMGIEEEIHTGLVKIDQNIRLTNEGRIVTKRKSAELGVVNLESGDIVLTCSDGLNDELTQQEIEELVRKYSGNPTQLAEALEKQALGNGGRDNITMILYKHGK